MSKTKVKEPTVGMMEAERAEGLYAQTSAVDARATFTKTAEASIYQEEGIMGYKIHLLGPQHTRKSGCSSWVERDADQHIRGDGLKELVQKAIAFCDTRGIRITRWLKK